MSKNNSQNSQLSCLNGLCLACGTTLTACSFPFKGWVYDQSSNIFAMPVEFTFDTIVARKSGFALANAESSFLRSEMPLSKIYSTDFAARKARVKYIESLIQQEKREINGKD